MDLWCTVLRAWVLVAWPTNAAAAVAPPFPVPLTPALLLSLLIPPDCTPLGTPQHVLRHLGCQPGGEACLAVAQQLEAAVAAAAPNVPLWAMQVGGGWGDVVGTELGALWAGPQHGLSGCSIANRLRALRFKQSGRASLARVLLRRRRRKCTCRPAAPLRWWRRRTSQGGCCRRRRGRRAAAAAA